jgi:hypothetical protein
VIEKNFIADAHLIAHKVTGLIVSDTEPIDAAIGHSQYALHGTFTGFGFHEPEFFRHGRLSTKEESPVRGCLSS